MDEHKVVPKPATVPTVLEETLLVEINDELVGTDAFGNKPTMLLSRAAFNQQKNDINMRVVKIVKPEGVTMQQQAEAEAKKVAEKPPKIEKPEKPPKPAAAPAPTSKAFAPPTTKKGKKVEEADPADADPPEPPELSEDEEKARIEEESMQNLLDSLNKPVYNE